MQRFIKLVTLLETENVQETEQSPGPERVGKQDALACYLFTKLRKKKMFETVCEKTKVVPCLNTKN